MHASNEPGPKGQAVAWLATCFVVMAGIISCTFIAVAMNANVVQIARYGGPLVLGVGSLFWLLRDRKPGGRLSQRWEWLSRRRRPKTRLKLTRVTASPRPNQPAPAPPTVESLRELKGGLNTWVPSEHRARSAASRPGEPPDPSGRSG